jgi:hypothetical protein
VWSGDDEKTPVHFSCIIMKSRFWKKLSLLTALALGPTLDPAMTASPEPDAGLLAGGKPDVCRMRRVSSV